MKNLLNIFLVFFLFLSTSPVHAITFPRPGSDSTRFDSDSIQVDSDSVAGIYDNWFNKDLKIDHIAGVSTKKAYELLKNKPSQPVIVAVIDGGVDITHEDIDDNIWVNEDEITGNGLDDDKNGYVDDIHGWNFLGNSEGENIEYETYELTRLYKKYSEKFEDKNYKEIKSENKEDYYRYLAIKKDYLKQLKETKEESQMLERFEKNLRLIDRFMTNYLKDESYTVEDVKAIESDDEKVNSIKDALLNLYKNGFSKENFKAYKEHIDAKLKYHLNPDFNPRKIIDGDPKNMADASYGNNNVKGPDASHGTHVAGIIAAERNNGIGMNGIATNVKIMAIRAVPNGDERDKDVANAIRYAVNNGAQIINMSFGKDYSPQKEAVDLALKLAEDKGVLMVHAAGNDAADNDEIMNYPVDQIQGKEVDNWITVGATNLTADKDFVADFSNYGRHTVDIFAPGEDIYSLAPGDEYEINSGTSMASPVVAGVAALIMSYYPDLSAFEVKKILLKSAQEYKRLKVYLPEEASGKDPEIVKFKKLSVSGGVVNAYEAVKRAEKRSN